MSEKYIRVDCHSDCSDEDYKYYAQQIARLTADWAGRLGVSIQDSAAAARRERLGTCGEELLEALELIVDDPLLDFTNEESLKAHNAIKKANGEIS